MNAKIAFAMLCCLMCNLVPNAFIEKQRNDTYV